MFWTSFSNTLRKQCYSTAQNYKQSVTDLSKMSANEISKWLDSFDAVLTDCDGVLWEEDEVIEGSDKVINGLKSLGKKVFFATNNSTKTQFDLAEKAQRLGFNIEQHQVLIPTRIVAKYLQKLNFNQKVYVIGTPAIGKELDRVGIPHIGIGVDLMQTTYLDIKTNGFNNDPDIGAVIVGFDEHISYPKMVKGATYLEKPGVLFIATNTDERGIMPHVVMPCSGSMVRAMEAVAERKSLIVGKPNPMFCADLLEKEKLQPERTLMIGDRGNTDVLFGYNCKFQTLMVGSGVHSLKDVAEWKRSNDVIDNRQVPDVYLPKLGDLLPHLKSK